MKKEPDALDRRTASEPIGLRIGIDSSWDLDPLVDFLDGQAIWKPSSKWS